MFHDVLEDISGIKALQRYHVDTQIYSETNILNYLRDKVEYIDDLAFLN